MGEKIPTPYQGIWGSGNYTAANQRDGNAFFLFWYDACIFQNHEFMFKNEHSQMLNYVWYFFQRTEIHIFRDSIL